MGCQGTLAQRPLVGEGSLRAVGEPQGPTAGSSLRPSGCFFRKKVKIASLSKRLEVIRSAHWAAVAGGMRGLEYQINRREKIIHPVGNKSKAIAVNCVVCL